MLALHKAGTAQFARFLATGLLNTAFGYGVFAALIWLGAPAAAAVALATVLGVLFNYQTSRRFVFREHPRGRLVRFAAAYLFLYGVNVLALELLMRQGLSAYAGNALLIVPMALLAFVVQRYLVFALPKDRP